MKNIIRLLFICSFCLSSQLNAQEIVVSQEILLKNDYYYEILGNLDGRILLLRDNVYEIHVEAFDEDLRHKWSRKVDLGKRKIYTAGAIAPNEKEFAYFYTQRNKGEIDFFVRKYDNDLQLQDSMLIKREKSISFFKKYKMVASENKKKLLFTNQEKDHEVQILAFDVENMELMYEGIITFADMYLRRDLRSIQMSNEGEMFLMFEKDNTKLKKKKHQFVTYYMAPGNDNIKEFTTSVEEHLSYDVHVEYDNLNKKLVYAGFYTDKNLLRAIGYYYGSLSPYGEGVQEIMFKEFDDVLLQDVYGKELKNKKGLTDFSIEKIVKRVDGGIIMICEMNKEFSRRPSYGTNRRSAEAGYLGSSWVDYYSEDLLVMAVHPDGEEHWNTVLRKKQYSQDDAGAFSSFFLFKTPTAIKLLYNDEIKNENTVSEYVLSANGKTERNSLFSTEYQKLKLRFKEAVQLTHDSCLVPSERNSRLSLVRISY